MALPARFDTVGRRVQSWTSKRVCAKVQTADALARGAEVVATVVLPALDVLSVKVETRSEWSKYV